MGRINGEDILNILKDNEDGLNQDEISGKLGTTRQTVSNYLKVLIKDGLIAKKVGSYPFKYYLTTKEIILTNPLINLDFTNLMVMRYNCYNYCEERLKKDYQNGDIDYLLKKIHEILNSINDIWLIFDLLNKHENERKEIIEKVLSENFGRYGFHPANIKHVELINEIINDFIELIRQNKPDIDKIINKEKREVYRVYNSLEQDILHNLKINCRFSNNSFLNLINSDSIRKKLYNVILEEVFQNPIYYKGIKIPEDFNFEINIKYNYGEFFLELINSSRGTTEEKTKKILNYLDKSLGVENIQSEFFNSIQKGYNNFLENYNKIIKELKEFKQNMVNKNEVIKDEYLPLEAFVKDERNFSDLNRRGFFFSLKSFPIISLFNRLYWKEWQVVDQNGLLNFFKKTATFLGNTENYIFLQWGYFIDKLNKLCQKAKEDFEDFVKILKKYKGV